MEIIEYDQVSIRLIGTPNNGNDKQTGVENGLDSSSKLDINQVSFRLDSRSSALTEEPLTIELDTYDKNGVGVLDNLCNDDNPITSTKSKISQRISSTKSLKIENDNATEAPLIATSTLHQNILKILQQSKLLKPYRIEVRNDSYWYAMRTALRPRRHMAVFMEKKDKNYVSIESSIYDLKPRQSDLEIVPTKCFLSTHTSRWTAFKHCEAESLKRDSPPVGVKGKDILTSHLSIMVVSDAFEGVNNINRLRMVYETLLQSHLGCQLHVPTGSSTQSPPSPSSSSSSSASLRCMEYFAAPIGFKLASTYGTNMLQLQLFRVFMHEPPTPLSLTLANLKGKQQKSFIFQPPWFIIQARSVSEYKRLNASNKKKVPTKLPPPSSRPKTSSASASNTNTKTMDHATANSSQNNQVTSTAMAAAAITPSSDVDQLSADVTGESQLPLQPPLPEDDADTSHEAMAQKVMDKYQQFLQGLTLESVHQLIVERRMDKELLATPAAAAAATVTAKGLAKRKVNMSQTLPSLAPRPPHERSKVNNNDSNNNSSTTVTGTTSVAAKPSVAAAATTKKGSGGGGYAATTKLSPKEIAENALIDAALTERHAIRLQRILRIRNLCRAIKYSWKYNLSILHIQRYYRGCKARKFYRFWKTAFPLSAIKVQKRFRNYKGAVELEMWFYLTQRILKVQIPRVRQFLKSYIHSWREHRVKMATKIQSILRMWKWRSQFLAVLHERHRQKCIIFLQSVYRRYLAKCIYLILKEEARVQRIDVPAAIKIQKTYRGKIYGRDKLKVLKTRFDAAVIIQKFFQYLIWYRFRVTKCVRNLKRHFSSIIVQKIYRGWVDRMKINLLKNKLFYYEIYIPNVIFIQSIVRSYLCRKHYVQTVLEINAALVIQKTFRAYRRRLLKSMELNKLKQLLRIQMATKIQAIVRRFLARLRYFKYFLIMKGRTTYAAKVIMHAWQSFKGRKHLQIILDNHRLVYYNKQINKLQQAIETITQEDVAEINQDIEHARNELTKKSARVKELKEFNDKVVIRLAQIQNELKLLNPEEMDRGWGEALYQEFRSFTFESKLAIEEVRLHRAKIKSLEKEILELELELEESCIELDHLCVLEVETYEGLRRAEVQRIERRLDDVYQKALRKERCKWKIRGNKVNTLKRYKQNLQFLQTEKERIEIENHKREIASRDLYSDRSMLPSPHGGGYGDNNHIDSVFSTDKAKYGYFHDDNQFRTYAETISYDVKKQQRDYRSIHKNTEQNKADKRAKDNEAKLYKIYSQPITNTYSKVAAANSATLNNSFLSQSSDTTAAERPEKT